MSPEDVLEELMLERGDLAASVRTHAPGDAYSPVARLISGDGLGPHIPHAPPTA